MALVLCPDLVQRTLPLPLGSGSEFERLGPSTTLPLSLDWESSRAIVTPLLVRRGLEVSASCITIPLPAEMELCRETGLRIGELDGLREGPSLLKPDQLLGKPLLLELELPREERLLLEPSSYSRNLWSSALSRGLEGPSIVR